MWAAIRVMCSHETCIGLERKMSVSSDWYLAHELVIPVVSFTGAPKRCGAVRNRSASVDPGPSLPAELACLPPLPKREPLPE